MSRPIYKFAVIGAVASGYETRRAIESVLVPRTDAEALEIREALDAACAADLAGVSVTLTIDGRSSLSLTRDS